MPEAGSSPGELTDARRPFEPVAGEYLTFKLAGEVHGLEILRVREIIRVMDVTRVPRAREHLRGVINLRGKVIPVVDLRLKLGMERGEGADQAVIVVVQHAWRGREMSVGFLVDEVLEVRSIDAARIEAPPAVGDGTGTRLLHGVGKVEGHVIFLLDVGAILSDDEEHDPADALPATAAP